MADIPIGIAAGTLPLTTDPAGTALGCAESDVPPGTYFAYDEAGRLLGEYNAYGTALQETVWFDGRPVATGRGSAVYAVHTDHLGTPRAVTAADGRTVWRWPDDPFGTAPAEEDPDGDGLAFHYHLRFPGQYFDEETGLHYNWNRYYHPETNRYITSDPIGLTGGLNTYIYVGNNPVNWIDPLGLAGCYVVFSDYPITYAPGRSTTWLGGHAGVLGYNSSGSTRYYEYGRYSPDSSGIIRDRLPADQGNVRRVTSLDLVIGPDGNPTSESLQRLKDALSQRAGQGTRTELTCDTTADEDMIYDYVNDFAHNPNRHPYSWYPWSSDHCRTFASDALGSGQ